MSVLRGRDFITDVYTKTFASPVTTSPFDLQVFPLNVGLFNTFPWFSTIAGNYTKYHLRGLRFVFVSTSGSAINSTNAALGLIAVKFVADPTIPLDSSMAQLQNSRSSKIFNPSTSFDYAIPLGPDKLTVRTGSQPVNTDLRMYDIGYVEVATQGMQGSGVNLGQLFVEYEVAVYEPLYIQGSIGQTVRSCHLAGPGGPGGAANFTSAAPLGTSTVAVADNFLPVVVNTAGTGLIFPVSVEQGSYLVTIIWNGATAANLAAPGFVVAPNGFVNCGLKYFGRGGDLGGPSVSPIAGGTNTGQTTVFMNFLIEVNAPGNLIASVVLDGTGVFPTGSRYVDIVVQQYNALMN